eukprot:TRINITY_DN2385_c0_g1_i1.p1 TRINITY_DN2385_c0_g1~~TRINITY_DN2385_c0_g1_i1.p1  ORF type:complete len:893 (+),score=217.78 TRINITY_DN2385_c0_g1_i1:71-2680(+)
MASDWAASLRHATPNKPLTGAVSAVNIAPHKTPPVVRRLAHKENVCPSPSPYAGKAAAKPHEDHGVIMESDPPVHLMQLQQERLRAEVEKGFEEITMRANTLAQQRENLAREEEALRQRLLAVQATAEGLETRLSTIAEEEKALAVAECEAEDRRVKLTVNERELQARSDAVERRQKEVAEAEAFVADRLALRDEIRALEANIADQRKQFQRREDELRAAEQALRDRTAQMQRKENDIQELEEWTNSRHDALMRRRQELEKEEQQASAKDIALLQARIAELEAELSRAATVETELNYSAVHEIELLNKIRSAAEAEKLRADQASVRRRDDAQLRVLELEGERERYLGKEQHLLRTLDGVRAELAASQRETAQLAEQNALLQQTIQQLEDRLGHLELAAAAACGDTTTCEDDATVCSETTVKASLDRGEAMVLMAERIDQLQSHLQSREQQLQEAMEKLQQLQATATDPSASRLRHQALASELAAANARITELELLCEQATKSNIAAQEEAKSNEEELMKFAAAWESRAQELAAEVEVLQNLVHEMEQSRERQENDFQESLQRQQAERRRLLELEHALAASEAAETARTVATTSAATGMGASIVFCTTEDKECQFPDPIAPDTRRVTVVVPPLPLEPQRPPRGPALRSTTPTSGRSTSRMPAMPSDSQPPVIAPSSAEQHSARSGIIPNMRSSTPRAVCRSLTPRFPDGSDAAPFSELDVSEFCMATSDPKLAKVVKKQQKKLEKAMVKDAKRRKKESEKKKKTEKAEKADRLLCEAGAVEYTNTGHAARAAALTVNPNAIAHPHPQPYPVAASVQPASVPSQAQLQQQHQQQLQAQAQAQPAIGDMPRQTTSADVDPAGPRRMGSSMWL